MKHVRFRVVKLEFFFRRDNKNSNSNSILSAELLRYWLIIEMKNLRRKKTKGTMHVKLETFHGSVYCLLSHNMHRTVSNCKIGKIEFDVRRTIHTNIEVWKATYTITLCTDLTRKSVVIVSNVMFSSLYVRVHMYVCKFGYIVFCVYSSPDQPKLVYTMHMHRENLTAFLKFFDPA